jgi:hypothetical protein
MAWGRSERRLPNSLTQHLTDPKIVAFEPRPQRRASYRLPAMAQKVAISAVTIVVVVLAGGHLLRAW